RTSSGDQLYWLEEVADGLKFPSSMAWLPNGDALISEREGRLRVLRGGVLDHNPVSGVPSVFYNMFNGIKDVVIDPDYQSTRTIYLLIAEGTHDQHHAAVYRAKYNETKLLDVQRIFRSKE